MAKLNIESVLDDLNNNQSVRIGDLIIEPRSETEVGVIGWSQFLNITNLTRSTARRELEEIKTLFDTLLSHFPALKTWVKNKTPVYSLTVSDAGKCSITICVEKENSIGWAI